MKVKDKYIYECISSTQFQVGNIIKGISRYKSMINTWLLNVADYSPYLRRQYCQRCPTAPMHPQPATSPPNP